MKYKVEIERPASGMLNSDPHINLLLETSKVLVTGMQNIMTQVPPLGQGNKVKITLIVEFPINA